MLRSRAAPSLYRFRPNVPGRDGGAIFGVGGIGIEFFDVGRRTRNPAVTGGRKFSSSTWKRLAQVLVKGGGGGGREDVGKVGAVGVGGEGVGGGGGGGVGGEGIWVLGGIRGVGEERVREGGKREDADGGEGREIEKEG
ncbi:uncharacterized protein [Pyrus communis]|uniref:uncharacterized protein n=1 Tax=Pyrus communis TaxID=23211 RepID=UPI0035C1F0C0